VLSNILDAERSDRVRKQSRQKHRLRENIAKFI